MRCRRCRGDSFEEDLSPGGRRPRRSLGLTVAERFCGPPGAANGGVAAGLLAGRLRPPAGAAVEVTLRRSIPLGRRLDLARRGDGSVALGAGEGILAEARVVPFDVAAPPAPSFADAEAGLRRFPRFVDHPLPRCFVCGPDRAAGDGLRIFPGPIAEEGAVVAAPWTPDRSLGDARGFVRPEFVWAALDCAGAFAVNEPPRGLALLGRLAARVDGCLRVGEPAIVAGWPIGADGRKLVPGTAVYRATGELVAVARATWILVERSR